MSKKVEIEIFSVSEKLPNTFKHILVFLPDYQTWEIAGYALNDTWKDSDGDLIIEKISHWTELPPEM